MKDRIKGFSMLSLFFNFYFQGIWSDIFIGREFCSLHVSVSYVILLAMSRGCAFLISVIDLVKLFQPCCSNVLNTRPPPEPPPHSGKKKMIKRISFSVAGQTDASRNFYSTDFPLLVAGQTNSPFPVAGEAGSFSCNFLIFLWSSKKISMTVRLDYIIAWLAIWKDSLNMFRSMSHLIVASGYSFSCIFAIT
ncbi:unnamed protein product [Cuscuta epithymum]|uniref:Uncharacterized protein n=1 Tax=Cuscuta epithymum TaxID=186058 RepID=A0AAV0FAV7_9ASTE|nr:unnamed protein product [Cuscuta epithymum]